MVNKPINYTCSNKIVVIKIPIKIYPHFLIDLETSCLFKLNSLIDPATSWARVFGVFLMKYTPSSDFCLFAAKLLKIQQLCIKGTVEILAVFFWNYVPKRSRFWYFLFCCIFSELEISNEGALIFLLPCRCLIIFFCFSFLKMCFFYLNLFRCVANKFVSEQKLTAVCTKVHLRNS